MIKALAVLFVAVFCVCNAEFARADKWPLPIQTSYHSKNGHYQFVSVPTGRTLDRRELNIATKADERFALMSLDRPRGLLCRHEHDSECRTVWLDTLKNSAAPGWAIVANSGRWVVTFDEWGSLGYENVIVIYSADGSVAKSYVLKDFLTPEEIATFDRSVSSISWSGSSISRLHRFSEDERHLILQIYFPNTFDDSIWCYLKIFCKRHVERRLEMPAS